MSIEVVLLVLFLGAPALSLVAVGWRRIGWKLSLAGALVTPVSGLWFLLGVASNAACLEPCWGAWGPMLVGVVMWCGSWVLVLQAALGKSRVVGLVAALALVSVALVLLLLELWDLTHQ